MTYLDNAATTLIKPDSVRRSMAGAICSMSSPGRGGHKFAAKAAETAYICRSRACRLFGVDNPERIIFAFNATHALNAAINCFDIKGKKVVVSGYEHNAVLRPLIGGGANVFIARSGLFDAMGTVRAFDAAIDADTALAVVNYVSNVFGFVLPVEEISRICAEKRVPLIVDASQAAGICDIDADGLGADYIAAPGHKGLYGPQGTGLLICGKNALPRPYMLGGTGGNSALRTMPDFLPDMMEAGTHNMPGIAGLSAGIEFVLETGTERIRNHEAALLQHMQRELSGMKRVILYEESGIKNRTGVLSFNIDGISGEECADMLNMYGVAVRAGLHCAPLAHETAGTIERGTVRVSLSYFSAKRDVDHFLNCVEIIASAKGKKTSD